MNDIFDQKLNLELLWHFLTWNQFVLLIEWNYVYYRTWSAGGMGGGGICTFLCIHLVSSLRFGWTTDPFLWTGSIITLASLSSLKASSPDARHFELINYLIHRSQAFQLLTSGAGENYWFGQNVVITSCEMVLFLTL